MTNYVVDLLKQEELRILDFIDAFNTTFGKPVDPEELVKLKEKLYITRRSIETLEREKEFTLESSSRGIVNISGDGRMKIAGNVVLNQDKLKWDSISTPSKVSTAISNTLEKAWSPKDPVEIGLIIIKAMNDSGRTVTRLRLTTSSSTVVVEDFSQFCNSNYMSDGLLDAIKNKKTLTRKQQSELEPYIIEASLTI